ncbi:hypothetical protein OIU74_016469 [Salix koriyanagi]|uniref:Uncharacterized protein n=1 Tax=Salix koriyanagi TaxID=2511006 RepID=A0A9Q0PGI5_9ROSI|nr:hypothetical protein OIU74_016469 [Salix koriyanagi]
MRETSWVSRTTVRDEMGFRTEGGESLQATTTKSAEARNKMGFRDLNESLDGLQARDEMGTERGERRHRGTEEARDDGRSQARGEGNDESE